MIKQIFSDGIVNLNNMLANRRNAHFNNRMQSGRIDWDELRQIWRTGMGSKIVRLKIGIALNDTLMFESEGDRDFYEKQLQQLIKKAAKYQLGFGRALFVIHESGADLSQPLGNINDWSKVRYQVFSGDMVYVQSVDLNLNSVNYFKPTRYSVRGFPIHPSRVVDFKYVEPVEQDAPDYFYGGISEFELIRNELVSDGVVQRAVPAMLEKSSTLFYKVKDFKSLLADKQESTLVTYFTQLESLRSIYGAGIIDSEDEIQVHAQALTNLAESDLVTLRRLALVTGIPLSWLVGEAARGLNATGEGERQIMQQTIENLQSDYLLDNINKVMAMHGRGRVWFKDDLLQSSKDKMESQSKAIENAAKLYVMGEDSNKYLVNSGVIEKDSYDEFFSESDDEKDIEPTLTMEQLLGAENGNQNNS